MFHKDWFRHSEVNVGVFIGIQTRTQYDGILRAKLFRTGYEVKMSRYLSL
jgi:hypothetical protein